MKKQEQIERIESILTDVLCQKSKDVNEFVSMQSRDIALQGAKALTNKGYINGADFVEWLKDKWSLKFEWHNMTCVSAGDLNEALQEYLKGE